MASNELRVVLDSNIIISSLVFGGKPKEIVEKLLQREFVAVLSKPIIAEICDVLIKKFKFSKEKVKLLEQELLNKFEIVYPKEEINAVRDKDDNKIIEAAVEGKCRLIVSGDKDLLVLKKYKNIKILNSTEFLVKFFS
jgi:putative PIN family toxin of toxin-antitoxin system